MSPRRASEDVSQLGQSSAYEGASRAGPRGKNVGCGPIPTQCRRGRGGFNGNGQDPVSDKIGSVRQAFTKRALPHFQEVVNDIEEHIRVLQLAKQKILEAEIELRGRR